MSHCMAPGCARPTRNSSVICDHCATDLEVALGELPAWLQDLAVTETRQDRLGDAAKATASGPAVDRSQPRKALPPHLRSRHADYALPETPWPYSPDADEVLTVAQGTLFAWAKHIAETRGTPDPERRGDEAQVLSWLLLDGWFVTMTELRMWVAARAVPPRVGLHRGQSVAYRLGDAVWVAAHTGRADALVEDMRIRDAVNYARWLHVHIRSIRLDEAAGEIVDEVTSLRDRIRAQVDARDLGQFVGRCTNPIRVEVSTVVRITPEPCDAFLYRFEGRAKVKCPECGQAYDADELETGRKAAVLREIKGRLGTAAEIASWFGQAGIAVTVERIEQWRRRKHITPRAGLYAVDEVRELVESAKERQVVKLKRGEVRAQ